MKAKQRTLAVLVVLAILLGGALWAVNRTKTALEEAADAASEGSIPLAAVSASDLTQIQVTYNGETNTLDYADSSWTLAEDPAYHLDDTSCNTMLTALGSMNAGRTIEAQPGEDYGFEEPYLTVAFTAAGETHTLTFGAENTVTGDRYVKLDSADTIYTVSTSKVSCFAQSKAELFGSFNPAGITASSIQSLTETFMDGSSLSLMAVSEQTETEEESDSTADSENDADSTAYETVWYVADDTDTALDQSKVQSLLSALGTYVYAQVTGADPADYGFAKPLVTVQVTTDAGTTTVTYAAGTDGYYLMVEGDDSIYAVDGNTMAALMNSAEDLKAE